jgi:DNA gyrase/topoisomerase IV subunit B
MPQVLLNQILNQLQALEPSELQQLSQVIQRYLKDNEVSAKRAAFHQALVGSGLVRQIKNPNFEGRTHQRLIQVQGEPVSQTIVGERR